MPLSIVIDKKTGLSRPMFICDYCNKEITDAFEGLYAWNQSEGEDKITEIKYLHYPCDRRYQAKYGSLPYSMGIHNLMVYLLNNLKLTKEKLEEAYRNSADLSRI